MRSISVNGTRNLMARLKRVCCANWAGVLVPDLLPDWLRIYEIPFQFPSTTVPTVPKKPPKMPLE
ncbi:MAG: hypothetical protein V4717_23410 [Bacteroidota bacterium]